MKVFFFMLELFLDLIFFKEEMCVFVCFFVV